jgi:hypothetical protein
VSAPAQVTIGKKVTVWVSGRTATDIASGAGVVLELQPTANQDQARPAGRTGTEASRFARGRSQLPLPRHHRGINHLADPRSCWQPLLVGPATLDILLSHT